MHAVLKKPETLKSSAHRAIKSLLISGKLKQRTNYSASTLADMLGVSRTPVREALLELSSEGFLVAHDGKGFAVKALSEKRIRDFFETRKVIELYVLDQVAAKLPGEELANLRGHLRTMQETFNRGDIAGLIEANKAFHLLPINYHQNSHLISVMNNISDLMSLLGQLAIVSEDGIQAIINEHQAVVDALERRDTLAAVQAMRRQLESAEKLIIARACSLTQEK